MGTQSSALTLGAGVLIASPTSGAQGSAYGGTVLGTAQDVRLQIRSRSFPIAAAELGNDVIEEVHLGEEVNLLVRFAGAQADTLDRIFYDASSGVVSIPGSVDAGALVSSQAIALLFAPDDSTLPAVYLPKALPKHDRLDVPFSGFLPMRFDVRFLALDSSGTKLRMGPAASIQSAWGA